MGLRLYPQPCPVTLAKHKRPSGVQHPDRTASYTSYPAPASRASSSVQSGMGEGWDWAADGNLLLTASQMDSRLTSGGLTPQKVLKMGPLKHLCLELGSLRGLMGSFNSSLGGHSVVWAGQSWVAGCPSLNPTSMPCLLSLPAPSVGSEKGWDRLLCPDKHPQSIIQSLQPLALPLAGWQNGKSHPLVPGGVGASARKAGNAQMA